jgi:hypothetical protein
MKFTREVRNARMSAYNKMLGISETSLCLTKRYKEIVNNSGVEQLFSESSSTNRQQFVICFQALFVFKHRFLNKCTPHTHTHTDFRDLNKSPSIASVAKSRRQLWAEHVARMGRQ